MPSSLPRSSSVAIALCITVLAGDLVLAWSGASRRDASPKSVLIGSGASGNSNGNANGQQEFRITGSASGLYPGSDGTLVLTVSNPFTFAIRVTELKVTAGSAGAGCPGSMVLVTTFKGGLDVARKGTASQALRIRMVGSAPDGCAGATFPLAYHGEAVKR